MDTNRGNQGILSEALNDKREAIVDLLKTAYFMELETVMNYVTNSINPDGVRAQEVKENIEEDIQEELGHAQQIAARIKELYGVVPGSADAWPRDRQSGDPLTSCPGSSRGRRLRSRRFRSRCLFRGPQLQACEPEAAHLVQMPRSLPRNARKQSR